MKLIWIYFQERLIIFLQIYLKYAAMGKP